MPSTNTSQYPFNESPPPRKLIVAGRWKRPVRQIKQDEQDIPVLRTPPCQTDEERGQGDSTNSRLHRLISEKK